MYNPSKSSLFDKNKLSKVLISSDLPNRRGRGGVASAWMIYEMKKRGLCPSAIIFNTVNPILAQGAAHGGIAMLSGFDCDITSAIPSGSKLRIDPKNQTVEIL